MMIELPTTFGPRVSNLVLCLDRYEAATGDAEREQTMREALSISCGLLSDIDQERLGESLWRLLGEAKSETRQQAAEILRRSDLYSFFEVIEQHLLDRAGLTFPARERVLSLIEQCRQQAAEDVGHIHPKELVEPIAELRGWICEWKERWIDAAEKGLEAEESNAAHTRIVNSLGTATIVINAAAGLASAASILFLPMISVAACAASVTLGGVAQRLKPRSTKPDHPAGRGDSGTMLRLSRPPGNRYKLR